MVLNSIWQFLKLPKVQFLATNFQKNEAKLQIFMFGKTFIKTKFCKLQATKDLLNCHHREIGGIRHSSFSIFRDWHYSLRGINQ